MLRDLFGKRDIFLVFFCKKTCVFLRTHFRFRWSKASLFDLPRSFSGFAIDFLVPLLRFYVDAGRFSAFFPGGGKENDAPLLSTCPPTHQLNCKGTSGSSQKMTRLRRTFRDASLKSTFKSDAGRFSAFCSMEKTNKNDAPLLSTWTPPPTNLIKKVRPSRVEK